jgi:hypothetical protein
MLTVCTRSDAAKTVASHDTLKSLSFRRADHVDGIAGLEYVGHTKLVTEGYIVTEPTPKFHHLFLRPGAGRLKMAGLRSRRMFVFGIAGCELDSVVSVFAITGFDLGNHIRRDFDHGAGNIIPNVVEDARHAYLLSN